MRKLSLCLISLIVLAILIKGNFSKFEVDDSKSIPDISLDTPKVLNPTDEMLKFQDAYMSLNGEIIGERQYLEIILPEYNLVKYVTPEEVLEIREFGTGLIYFGFPTCPWCRQAVPILIDVALDLGIEEIYYIDMKEIRSIWELQAGVPVQTDPGHPKYQELLEAFKSVIETMEENPFSLEEDGHIVSTGELRIFVPMVVAIKDGEIVDYHYYTVDNTGLGSQWEDLSELDAIWLRRIYERVSRSLLPVVQKAGCDTPC